MKDNKAEVIDTALNSKSEADAAMADGKLTGKEVKGLLNYIKTRKSMTGAIIAAIVITITVGIALLTASPSTTKVTPVMPPVAAPSTTAPVAPTK